MKNITTTYSTAVKPVIHAHKDSVKEIGFGGRQYQIDAYNKFIDQRNTLFISPTASGKSLVQVVCAAKQILDSNYVQKQLFIAPQLDIGNNFSEYKIKHIKVDNKEYEWEITHNFCKNNKMSVNNLKKFLLSSPDCSAYKKKNKIGGITAVCTSACFSSAWKILTQKQKFKSIINLSVRIDEAHHVMGVSTNAEQNRLGDFVKFALDNNGCVHLTTATFFRADNQPIIDIDYLPKFSKYTVPFLQHWECLGLASLTQEYRTYTDAQDLKQQILQDIRDNPDQKPMIIVPATGIGYFQDKKLKKKWVKQLVLELEELFGIGKVLDLVSSDTQKQHKKRITSDVQDFSCVVTCAIGREGTDWMACNKVHNTTVDNSVGLAIQKLGRPMRSYKGKTSITMVNYFPEMPSWDSDREEIRGALSDRYNAVIVASMMNDNFCPIGMPAKIKKKYEPLETNKKSSYTLDDVYGPAAVPMLDDLYKSVDALPVEEQTNEKIDGIIGRIIEDNKDAAIYDAADEDVRECLKKQLIRSKNASVPKLKLEPVDVAYVREAGWDKVIEETVKGKSFFTATSGKDEMSDLQKFLKENGPKASYKQHVEEGRKYKNTSEYNNTVKDNKFYTDTRMLKYNWPNEQFENDCGWLDRYKKASYKEHVQEARKYKSANVYRNTKKDNKFYSNIISVEENWPDEDFRNDCGWRQEKASYKQHVEEGKKYKNSMSYANAKKNKKFYSVLQRVKMVWPDKDFCKDCGWKWHSRTTHTIATEANNFS
jgi:hypothetical protein